MSETERNDTVETENSLNINNSNIPNDMEHNLNLNNPNIPKDSKELTSGEVKDNPQNGVKEKSEEVNVNNKDKSNDDDDDFTDMPPLEDRIPKSNENDKGEVVKDDSVKVDPETAKENDVVDECFSHKDKEGGKEEEEEYMDILGNGLLRRKVSSVMYQSSNLVVSNICTGTLSTASKEFEEETYSLTRCTCIIIT